MDSEGQTRKRPEYRGSVEGTPKLLRDDAGRDDSNGAEFNRSPCPGFSQRNTGVRGHRKTANSFVLMRKERQ